MQNSFCEECKRRALVEMYSGLNRSVGEKNIKVGWEIKSRQFGGTIRGEVYGFMDALDLEGRKKGRRINPTLTWGPLGKLSMTEPIRHLIQCLISTYDSQNGSCAHVCCLKVCLIMVNRAAMDSIPILRLLHLYPILKWCLKQEIKCLFGSFWYIHVFRHLSSCLPNCLSYRLCSFWHIYLFVTFFASYFSLLVGLI